MTDTPKSQRRNITMPPDWWAAFEAAAQAEGRPLSDWMGRAARRALTAEQRKALAPRSGRGRPAKTEEKSV